MRIIFLLFIISPSLSFFVSAQNIYDSDHSLKYAEHLFSSGKYEIAAKEYERLLFFSPNNDSLIFHLSLSYLRSRQYEKSLSLIEPKAISDSKFLNQYLNLLLLTRQYEKGKNFCTDNKNISDEKKNNFTARMLLCSGDWIKINETTVGIKECEKLFFSEAQKFHRKIPVIALGLSVIPGLGKVYTKNYADAAMSFFTVGICSFLAYRGFDKKGIESVPGWFYGGLGAGLYLGNFYGGVKAAKTYNKNFHEHISNEMEEIIVWE